MKEQLYAVYIMASRSEVLYIGVTNDLQRRVWEYKNYSISGFTKHYNCTKLVWFEQHQDIITAIAREKQLKNWHRGWKLNLIKRANLSMEDLSKNWTV